MKKFDSSFKLKSQFIDIFQQALHRQEILESSVNELKVKVEENPKTKAFTEKELNKQIVTLDGVC